MGIEPRVASVAAAGVLDLIGQCGGNVSRIFGAAGVSERDVTSPGAIDLRRYCALFEQAARQTGDEIFGLRFGTGYKLENMGALGELAVNSATLGDGLRNLCAYFPAIQEHSTLALEEAEGFVFMRYLIRDGRIAQRRQDAELTIAMFSTLFTRALGPGWAPEEVHFEHLRGADAAEIRGVVRAPVYFAAPSNALVVRRTDLAARMPGADVSRLPALHAQVRAQAAAARPDDFVGRVVAEIRGGFQNGDASIDAVAGRLGFSRAGLYRRLAAEGVDFSALTQRVRQTLAEFYVGQAGIAFTEIAPLLGYSELSAFSRAFARWTGRSPQAFRAERVACA
jgi:AraC-like DNA-binding protein